MPTVCIITDSTAQFTQANFPGHELVYVIPHGLQDISNREGEALPGHKLLQPQLTPPTSQEFGEFYNRLSREFDSILVLTLASLFSPALKNASLALAKANTNGNVEVIDSQTTAIGLGMLVQLAARAATDGASLKDLDRKLRASIPHVYMLFCIPDLTYLARSGLMEKSQALVAEMIGILPVFAFEEGRLVPMEKVRTPRHLFEAFQDFMGEFESPARIALVGNPGQGNLRATALRQFVKDTFPLTLFSEHPVMPHLAALLGPGSIGLFVMEPME
jgi:DegV family protein with EDD domain